MPAGFAPLLRTLTPEFLLEVAKGNVPGHSLVNKYGRNPDIDIASGFEAIWSGGGDYTGHDCIVAETLEAFSSSANDAGALLSIGSATGGSATTLVDTSASFVTDTVAAGDVVINDTQRTHGIVIAVTETVITVARMKLGEINEAGDAYRIATKASTGAPVVFLDFLLDTDHVETSEYLITNGVTPVDTVGTYLRHSRGKCYGGTNAGEITARQKTTTANVTMVLPAGYNSTMIAAYTIPKGKIGYLISWHYAVASKKAGFNVVKLMTRPVNDEYQVLEELALATTGTSFIKREFQLPKNNLHAMTDIKIVADASANDMGVAAGFDILLVDNL